MPQSSLDWSAGKKPFEYQLAAITVEPSHGFREIFTLFFANALITSVALRIYESWHTEIDSRKAVTQTTLVGDGLIDEVPLFICPTSGYSLYPQFSFLGIPSGTGGNTSNSINSEFYRVETGFVAQPLAQRTLEFHMNCGFMEMIYVPEADGGYTMGALLACKSCSLPPRFSHEVYSESQR